MLTTVIVKDWGTEALTEKRSRPAIGQARRHGSQLLVTQPHPTLPPGSNQRAISSGAARAAPEAGKRGDPEREATSSCHAELGLPTGQAEFPLFFTFRVLPASEGGPAPSSSSRGRAAATAFVALGCERVEAAILGPAHAGRQRDGTVERRNLQLRYISRRNRAPSQPGQASSGRVKKCP